MGGQVPEKIPFPGKIQGGGFRHPLQKNNRRFWFINYEKIFEKPIGTEIGRFPGGIFQFRRRASWVSGFDRWLVTERWGLFHEFLEKNSGWLLAVGCRLSAGTLIPAYPYTFNPRAEGPASG
jgi:hypothetical protein